MSSAVIVGRLNALKKRFRSQNEMADRIGVSRQSLGFWLNGERSPSAENIATIASRLGVSADWILGIGGEQKQTEHMTLNEYQHLAARTIRTEIGSAAMMNHALHGMVSEVGELHGLHQKVYQGHPMDEEHAKKELGDQMWFIAEYCTAHGWDLDEIGRMNIDKLKARFPDGFSEERSLHRAEGDV